MSGGLDLRVFESTDDRLEVDLPCGVTGVFRPLSPPEARAAQRLAGSTPIFGSRVNEQLVERAPGGGDALLREIYRLEQDDPEAHAARETFLVWRLLYMARVASASTVSLSCWPGWVATSAEATYTRLLGIVDEQAMGTLVGEAYAATVSLRELSAQGKARSPSPSGLPADSPGGGPGGTAAQDAEID